MAELSSEEGSDVSVNSRGREDCYSTDIVSCTPPSSRSSSTASIRPKPYFCDYEGCGKAYSRPSLLTQHQRSHTDTRPFVCQFCSKSFYRETHLKTHLLSHTEDKPFKCSTCGKGVNTKQHLRRHEITHTKHFKCTYENCEESFFKHQSLRHHIQSVHLKSLTCKECGKTFQRPYRLANHMTKIHGESPAYQCTFPNCYKNFKTWSALQLHLKSEHPKLICEICGKACVGANGLAMHMSIHNEDSGIGTFGAFGQHHESLKDYGTESNTAINMPPSISTEKIEKVLSKGGSAMDMLLKSIAALTKTIPCTHTNCSRMFRRPFDLQRHLQWHEKQRKKIREKAAESEICRKRFHPVEDDSDDGIIGIPLKQAKVLWD